MRVLLTGAGGFVGHHVLEHLLVNTDWEVVCTDSFRHRGIAERIKAVLNTHPGSEERVRVITQDLTTPWSRIGIIELGHIDYIVNIASESHVDRSIGDPVPFVRNNVDLVLNMLELSRAIRPAAFIQLSTDEVYGPQYTRPMLEWDPIIPSNPYAASKAAQEAIAISYWRTYGVPLVILNCMNLIGERQDREKFVPMTIGKVLRGEIVQIHASAGGETGARCWLHARNLADAILYTLRYSVAAGYPAVTRPPRWNIVGKHATNLQMAVFIAAAVGKPLREELVDFHGSRPGHDLHYAMDGGKMRQNGWTPPVELWASLKKTVEWTMAHREWL